MQTGIISYALPRAGFHDHLRRIVEAAFLTPGQKRDIFYNNAARFLKLSDAEMSRHARQ